VDIIKEEFLGGIGNADELLRVLVRLIVASLLGGLMGLERQHEGKAAGTRTHMLVALGAALFVLVPLEPGIDINYLSRVIQGIAAGVGFIGAGTILKLTDFQEIKGLTTAASIWMTAAVGVAVGAGRIGLALLRVGLGLFILYILHWIEWRLKSGQDPARAGAPSQNRPDGTPSERRS
jgi:putative Mg2+ transporter-C (MgtC) family protein